MKLQIARIENSFSIQLNPFYTIYTHDIWILLWSMGWKELDIYKVEDWEDSKGWFLYVLSWYVHLIIMSWHHHPIAHAIFVLDILFNGSNSRQPLCNLSTAYLKHRAWIINTHQDLRASIILVILSFISRSDPLTTNNTKGIEAFQVDAWRCSTCKRGFIIHHALYCRTTLMSHLQHLARLTLFHIHHPLWRLHFYISIFLVMILGIHLPA